MTDDEELEEEQDDIEDSEDDNNDRYTTAREYARKLDDGTTAEEINYVLKKEGYQDGEPSNYHPTEKGEDVHATGELENGVKYNMWTESTLESLDLSSENKKEADEYLSERKKELKKEREEQADLLYGNKVEESNPDHSPQDVVGKILLVIGGSFLAFLGFIGIKKLIEKKKQKKLQDQDKEQSEDGEDSEEVKPED